MLHDDPGTRSSRPRPHITFPFRTPRHLARRHLLLSAILCVVILSGVIAGWSTGVFTTHAAGPRTSAPSNMTFDQFLKEGHQDHTYRGPVNKTSRITSPPGKGSQHYANYAALPPSAEPATMQPLSAPLTSAFLAGSDGRLEVQLQPGSLDLSHATVSKGGAPVGALSLHLTQIHGHTSGQKSVLGSYQLQLVDSQSHVVNGLALHAPVTIIYHYHSSELAGLGLDPGKVILSWPTLIAAARKVKHTTTGLLIPMHNDPLAHTLTAQSMVLDASPFTSSGTPANQSLPALHLASVQGNSGQSSYSYPLQVPPGTGGFTPHLTLTYSSAGPNERHNATSPAGDEGDGWSLNLGSISAEIYPTTPATTWYFLNNVANVGDRLIPSTGNSFDTEHISYLKILQVTANNQPCFHVWDKSGTYYELGCSTDSLQYWTDSSGTRTNYRWDVDKIVAPSEGPNSTYYRVILVSYVQDSVPTGSYTTIRDASLKQIIYGDGQGTSNSVTDVAGTVDFQYHGQNSISSPSGDSSRTVTWVQPYNTNYDCITNPPINTTLRCDDPMDIGNEKAPLVMSTLTLDTVTSYVGTDAGASPSYADTSYAFSYAANPPYADAPFKTCTDPVTLAQQYCAGEHHLISITPTVYQNQVAHQLHSVQFGYATLLTDTYYDSTQSVGSQSYSTQTSWDYLIYYQDLNTGVGGTITYATAYNNTHGTPTVKNGTTITDDRYDALYCTTHATDPDQTLRCTGNYAHPDDNAWAEQVVTSLTALGTDSSASSLQLAKTTFSYYRLAYTGTYSGSGVFCYPDQYTGGEKDCVGDNWIPSGDGDWQDYYHGEYQGFAQVWTISPANDLTVDYYYSTEGWKTPMSDYQNFLGGMRWREEVYSGTSYTPTALLTRTNTDYATLSNACRSTTVTYPACEQVVLDTQATDFEGSNSSSAPTVQHTYTYDDYAVQYGLPGGGYHNVLSDSMTSSNGQAPYKLWTYSPNDQTVGTWIYYTVNTVSHSEIDDISSHIWQCQDITYDEGAPSGAKTPSQGLATTIKTYTRGACTQTRGSVFTTTYQGYDAYGNAVASVDGVAAAKSSLYTNNGCTLSTTPVIMSSAWTQSHYTACTTYDSYHAQPATMTNALKLASSTSYDNTQGSLPTSATGVNGQTTSTSYSYDVSGNSTVQVILPLHTGSYTSQSSTASNCSGTSTLPCFEVDTKSYQYNTVSASTFYDSLGRAVETRTPGPGSSYDTLVITTYNDQAHSVWQSVPFESGLDPEK